MQWQLFTLYYAGEQELRELGLHNQYNTVKLERSNCAGGKQKFVC